HHLLPPLYLVERALPGAGAGGPPRAGIVMTVASFDVTDGRVTRIWAVRNPEKLRPWARHDLS
ncbi:RNA polymerase subunit sigma-24, partial [Streptomyces globisporus]